MIAQCGCLWNKVSIEKLARKCFTSDVWQPLQALHFWAKIYIQGVILVTLPRMKMSDELYELNQAQLTDDAYSIAQDLAHPSQDPSLKSLGKQH